MLLNLLLIHHAASESHSSLELDVFFGLSSQTRIYRPVCTESIISLKSKNSIFFYYPFIDKSELTIDRT